MHVKMNYVLQPLPAAAPAASGMSKSAVENMIRVEMNKRGNSRPPQRQGQQQGRPQGGNQNGKTTNKKIMKSKEKKETCRPFNGAEGYKRRECRFRRFCTKCKKHNCTRGAANCEG